MTNYHDDGPRKRKKTATASPAQPDLFSLPTADVVARGAARGRELKKEAMQRVDDNASTAWKAQAETFMRQLCESKPLLAPDDLWLSGLPHPREPRAMGPVVTRAVKAGWIRALPGQLRKSRRPEQHGHPLQLYESLLYRS